MSKWRRRLLQYGAATEAGLDRARRRLAHRMGVAAPIQVIPFHSYGTSDSCWVKGRVLRMKGLAPASADDRWWTNARRMSQRFLSSEVPHAPVQIYAGAQKVVTEADGEGFFEAHVPLDAPLAASGLWRTVKVSAVDPFDLEAAPTQAEADVLVPQDSTFGVISDIDDTILVSHVTSKPKLALVMLLGNAHTRLAFSGVGAFYRALQVGTAGTANPIFYVSNSPWNLYDFMDAFMYVNAIPKGPIFLRDYGLNEQGVTLRSTADHKLERIRRLLATYPGLPFILLGDSSEQDPYIYQQIAIEHPGRIAAIYIRDVTEGMRTAELSVVVDDLRMQGVDMMLAPNTAVAAVHAAKHGFIAPEAVDIIQQDVAL